MDRRLIGKHLLRVIVISVVVAAGAPGVGDAATFGPTIRLNEASSFDVAVTVGGAGDAAVAWKTTDGLHVARRSAGGGSRTWNTAVLHPGAVREVAVVVNAAGRTIVAFEPVDANGAAPLVVTAADRDQPFGPGQVMATASHYRMWPALTTMSSGRVALSYLQRASRHRGQVRLALESRAGRPMSRSQIIGIGAQAPAIVAAGGGTIVIWPSALQFRHRARTVTRTLLARRVDAAGAPVGRRSVLSRAARYWNIGAGNPRGSAVAAWAVITPGPDRVTACRLVGTPVRCRQRADFGPLFSGHDPAHLAIDHAGRMAIGWVAGPPGGGAMPMFSIAGVRGRWSASRALFPEPTGVMTLAVAPDPGSGFLGLTDRDVGTYGLSRRALTGPRQVLGTAPYFGDLAVAQGGSTVVAAWTGEGVLGRSGAVEVAVAVS